MSELDAATLAAALEAWEQSPSAFDEGPYETFRAAHRAEARYLWLLSRRFAPPKELDREALRNMLAWGLVRADGTITALGARLLRATGARIGPDPFASDPAGTRFRW